MNKTWIWVVGAIIIVAALILVFVRQAPPAVVNTFEECVAAGNPVMETYPRRCAANGQTFTETISLPVGSDPSLRIDSPQANQAIQSPLAVMGEARGTWFFEASFPVRLLDGNGKEIASVPAESVGEWMTEAFVPFSARLTFTAPETATGTLVLEKANHWGLPEQAAAVSIPVRFLKP